MKYDRILAAVAGTPWAIDPEKGRVIAAVLSRRAADPTAGPPAGFAPAGRGKPKPKGNGGGVGVIQVYGVLTQRADLMTETSGLSSCEEIGQMVDRVAADPSATTVVFDIDSPGGSVFGVAELAAKIAALSRVKKTVAVANSTAASAAYWLASQASELVVTPGGQVGSIGVYLMHVDRSGELGKAGQAVTFVSAGEKKTAGNEYGPLADDARADMQAKVDTYYGMFVSAVAAGRKTTPAAVRAGYGKGGMATAADAVRQGMADRVGTLESVLAGYGVYANGVPPLAAAPLPGLTAAGKPVDPGIERRRRMLDMDAADLAALDAAMAARRAALPYPTAAKPAPPKAAPVKPAPTVSAPPAKAERRPWAVTRAVAFHEAAHAVVALELGGHVLKATIKREGDMDGYVQHTRMPHPAGLTVSKAGAAAEKVFNLPLYDGKPENTGDFEYAETLSRDPREHAQAEAQAAALVRLNAGKVAKLADALLRYETLDAAGIADALR